MKTAAGENSRVISWNLKLGCKDNIWEGGGRKHAQSANLYGKTLNKTEKLTLSWEDGGCHLSIGGGSIPYLGRRGV